MSVKGHFNLQLPLLLNLERMVKMSFWLSPFLWSAPSFLLMRREEKKLSFLGGKEAMSSFVPLWVLELRATCSSNVVSSLPVLTLDWLSSVDVLLCSSSWLLWMLLLNKPLRLKEPSDNGLAFRGLFPLRTTGLFPLLVEKDFRRLLAHCWKPRSGGVGSGWGRLGFGGASGSGWSFGGFVEVLSRCSSPEVEGFSGAAKSQLSSFSFSDKDSVSFFLGLREFASEGSAVKAGSGEEVLGFGESWRKCARYRGIFGISSMGVDFLSSIRGQSDSVVDVAVFVGESYLRKDKILTPHGYSNGRIVNRMNKWNTILII